MAYFDAASNRSSQSLRGRLSRLFETPFDRRAQTLSDRIAALRALSDAELADYGISRDQIIDYVFRSSQRN